MLTPNQPRNQDAIIYLHSSQHNHGVGLPSAGTELSLRNRTTESGDTDCAEVMTSLQGSCSAFISHSTACLYCKRRKAWQGLGTRLQLNGECRVRFTWHKNGAAIAWDSAHRDTPIHIHYGTNNME